MSADTITADAMTADKVIVKSGMDPAFTIIIKTIIINKWRANHDDIYRSILYALFQRIFELLLAHDGNIILKEHQTVLPEISQTIKITHSRLQRNCENNSSSRENFLFGVM